MSIKKVTVEDLWPGDVITRREGPERIASIESQAYRGADYKVAKITFVTPSGLGMYTEYHMWEECVLLVG